MQTLSKKFLILSIFAITLCFIACNKDEDTTIPQLNTECTVKAFYKGTNVCHDGENAAAVELEDSGYLILPNFFAEVEMDAIQYDDTLYIEYENVDSTLFGSGALCGSLIVAPIADLTCVSITE